MWMAPFHGPELSLLPPISTKPLRARNSVHSQTGASVSFLLGYYHTIYTWWFFCFKAPSWLGAWTSPNKALWKASFYLFIIYFSPQLSFYKPVNIFYYLHVYLRQLLCHPHHDRLHPQTRQNLKSLLIRALYCRSR